MRRNLAPCMAAAVLVSLCVAPTARAQTAVPPAPSASLEPPAARYARRSIALLGGFDVTHVPSADQTNVDAINVQGTVRFITPHGFVVQPDLSIGYFGVAPGRGVVGAMAAQVVTFRSGLRIGYAHAVSDRVAITATAGYRLEVRSSNVGLSSGPFVHSLLGQLSAEIFLTPQVFLEPSVVLAVTGSDDGIGLVTGIANSLGVMF